MNKYSIELKWGLIFVVMALVWMALERAVGLHSTHIDKHFIYTNLIAIPAVVIYVLGLRDKRENYYEGSMNYMQGLLTGLRITIVVTVLTPLTQWIISNVITPDYFLHAIEYSVENQKMNRAEAEEFFNLRNYIIQGVLFAPVMGVLTSLIVAIFTRKEA